MRLCASQGGRASDAGRQKRDYLVCRIVHDCTCYLNTFAVLNTIGIQLFGGVLNDNI